MTKTVNVYLFGKRYQVPENLTITGRVHLGPEKSIAAGLP